MSRRKSLSCSNQSLSCLSRLGGAVIVAILFSFLFLGGVFKTQCGSVNGRVCNDKGDCLPTGVCNCTDPFFSGPTCSNTLGSYLMATNQECNGNGLIGTKTVPISMIPEPCREITTIEGKSGGDWLSDECNTYIQGLMLQYQQGTIQSDDLFVLPICQCHIPFTGSDCSQVTCPRNVAFQICSGQGNNTVDFDANGTTTTGLGCQCAEDIIQPLSKSLRSTYSWDALSLIANNYAMEYSKPMCGKLYTHSENVDLKLVLPSFVQNTDPTVASYGCHCNEITSGIACEQDLCATDANGNICGNHGHPYFGQGAELNSTRRLSTTRSETICDSGYVNCYPAADKCVRDLNDCTGTPACPAGTPIRCHDGTCVKKPGRSTIGTYATGIYDNLTAVIENNVIQSSLFADNSTFLSIGDMLSILTSMAGDGAYYRNATGTVIPGGQVYFDTSLVVVVMEGIDSNGTLTLTYRQTTRVVPAKKGTSIVIFEETFEEEQRRLFMPVELNLTIEVISATEIQISPSPFLYNVDTLIPTEWQSIRLVSHQDANLALVLDSESTQIQDTPTGDWFIANLTQGRIIIPGGDVITIDQCLEDITNCIWNVNTRLSYNGQWKLCGFMTPSQNLACSVTQPLPAYRRIQPVLIATSPLVAQFDWINMGPWYIGQVNDAIEDFTYDGDWLTLKSSSDFNGVLAMSFITVGDLVVFSACPPVQENASTYDQQWVQDTTRATSGLLPGSKVVAEIQYYGETEIVRGMMTGDNGQIQLKWYNTLVDPMFVRQVSETEYNQGIVFTSFRVFPTLCPNGYPAQFVTQDVENVPVSCSCTILQDRAMKCQCNDAYAPSAYECDCTGISSTVNHCACLGTTFGLHAVEQQLLTYQQTNLSTTTCYYQERILTTGSGMPSLVTNSVDPILVSDFEFKRPLWATYLNEVRVSPCLTGLYLGAKMSLLSDVYDVFFLNDTIETSCINNKMTLKPLYSLNTEDLFDSWVILNMSKSVNETVTITQVWAQEGVSIEVESVQASSNTQDKDNVLWNDQTIWASSDTDRRPYVALMFSHPRELIGVMVNIESLGMETNQPNLTIPVALFLQGSLDGIRWTTLAYIKSDVIHGEDQQWLTVDSRLLLKGVRLFSYSPFAIREFVPLTNQRCSQDGMKMIVDPSFQSIASQSLLSLMNTGRNDSLPCVYDNSCELMGGRRPAPGDDCADEKYLVEALGYAPYKWSLWQTVSTTTYFNQLSNFTLYPNRTLVKPTNFSVGILDTNPSYIVWTLNTSLTLQSLLPTLRTISASVQNNTIYFGPAPIQFFYVRLNGTQNWTVTELVDGYFPTYDIYKDMSLVEQGIACPTGSNGAACGSSNRLALKAPGLGCTMTPFQQQLHDDLLNRTVRYIENVALVDEYLKTGLVTFQTGPLSFVRNVTVLSRGPCNDCQGLLQCPTGQCVTSLDLCPTPRINNYGNGCTKVDTRSKKYKCVCAAGWGGLACNFDYCIPGDPETGQVDPHRWCSCGEDPPLVVLPGRSLVAPISGSYGINQLLLVNYDGLVVTDPKKAKLKRVGYSFAPFPIRVLYSAAFNGVVLHSQCPFYKRGPFGQKIMFEEMVIRDPVTDDIIDYVKFDTLDPNVKVQYMPPHPFFYNDFPYRCPNSGQCQPTVEDCYNDGIINPICNGGRCRVDGTCDCPSGLQSFFYTPEWTNKTLIPYNADDPTEWGVARVYTNQHCKVQDCSAGQCSAIPMGCRTGTLANNFLDRWVMCPTSSGHPGKCGADYGACNRGEVEDPGPCSFNGIPYMVAYYPVVRWACYCGALKTPVVSFSTPNISMHRQQTELTPNGWGGPNCADYYCQQDSRKLHYSYRDPLTLQPYVDNEQVILPGKWIDGTCGAPAGPNPADLLQWQTCCPGYSRLSRCPKVLCLIGKTATCVDPVECTGAERSPMIYACNRQGTPLASGQCLCNYDEVNGVGYGPDATGEGCFAQFQCPKAANGQVCNRQSDSPSRWLAIEKKAGVEDQIYALAARMGINPTPMELINLVTPDFVYRQNIIAQAVILNIEQAKLQIAAAKADIDVWPNEDPAHPCCMEPYVGFELVIGPYHKAFNYPADVTPTTITPAFLIDRVVQYYYPGVSQNPRLNSEYFLMNRSMVITMPNATTISYIKMFIMPSQPGVTLTLSFKNYDTGAPVCEDLNVFRAADNSWRWDGNDVNIHSCVAQWIPYDFTKVYGYSINCQTNQNSQDCIDWQNQICDQLPNAEVQNPGTSNIYSGCPSTARCCVLTQEPYDPVTRLQIVISAGAGVNGPFLYIQEIALLGYGTTAQPMPDAFVSYVNWKSSGDPNNGLVSNNCKDSKWISYVTSPDGTSSGDGTLYIAARYIKVVNNQTGITPIYALNYDTAVSQCGSMGDWLAASDGMEDPNQYALSYGTACFSVASPYGDSRQCLVGARNRLEMRQPSISDFIQQSCSQFGSYMCANGVTGCNWMDSPRMDFYGTPDFGQQWTSDWSPGSILTPWSNFVNYAYQQAYIQPLMQLTDSGTVLFDLNVLAQRNPSQYANLYNTYRTYFASHGNYVRYSIVKLYMSNYVANIENPPNNIPTPTMQLYSQDFSQYANQQSPPLGSINSTLVSYWTSAETCRIRIYGQGFCGACYAYTAQGANYVSYAPSGSSCNQLYGPARTYIVTPADDYAALFNDFANFYNDVWTECANPALGTNCQAYGQPIVSESSTITSISIEGPCAVRLTRASDNGDGTTYYNSQWFTENQQPYPNVPPNYPLGIPVQYGCTPQTMSTILNGFYAPSDLDHWAFPPQQIYVSGAANDIYWFHQKQAGTGWADHYVAMRIIPMFNNYKVEVNIRAPYNDQNPPPADDFVMGITQQPFMCTRVDLRVLKGFYGISQNTLLGYSVSDGTDCHNTFTFGVGCNPDLNTLYTGQINWRSDINPSYNYLKSEPVALTRGTNAKLTYVDIEAMLANGPNQPYSALFVPCSTLGRTIIETPSCYKQQPQGIWEFDPRKYNPIQPDTWVDSVTTFNQTNFGFSTPDPAPEMYVTWKQTSGGITNSFMRYLGMQQTYQMAFVRLASLLQSSDYKVKFFFNHCVAVIKNPGTNWAVEYSFVPVVCEKSTYYAVCRRDFMKFTVMPGRDGDHCGSAGRNGALPNPAATAFSNNPLASRANNPILYAQMDAYDAGNLQSVLDQGLVDPKPVWDYWRYNTTQSVIFGIPLFQTLVIQNNGFCDRPGRLSPGVTIPNPNNWVCFDPLNQFPIDCGQQCIQETGICHYYRAVDPQYCDPNHQQFDEVVMAQDQYPLDLIPINQDITDQQAAKLQKCAVTIDPGAYLSSTIQSLALNDFYVIDQTPGESITVKVARYGNITKPLSWQNTGIWPSGYTFTNNTMLYGTFDCSRLNCNVSIWLSQMSTTYSTNPPGKIIVGNFNTSPFFIQLGTMLSSSNTYRVLGWDITGLQKDDTLTLSAVLASDPNTIASCRQPFPYTLHEMPTAMAFANAQLRCLAMSDPVSGLDAGQCLCEDDAFDGPACDRPAIVHPVRGKGVCGVFGVPGIGMAYDYDGNLVPVNSDGSWQSKNDPTVWGCATIDPGMIFRMMLYPASRFDYTYTLVSVRQLGQAMYAIVEPILDDTTLQPLILNYQNALDTCYAQTMSFPGWLNGDDALQFYELAAGLVTFIDLVRTPSDGNFRWSTQQITVVECGDDQCGYAINNPCLTAWNDPRCFAIQFNNLVYNSTRNALTDGTTENGYSMTGTATINLNKRVYEGLTVLIYTNGTFTVTVTVPEVDGCISTGGVTGTPAIFTCMITSEGYIDQIGITSHSGSGTVVVRELLVYKESDTTRFLNFYS